MEAGRNLEIGDRSMILTSREEAAPGEDEMHLSHDDIHIKAGGDVSLGNESFVFTDASIDVEAGGSIGIGSDSIFGALADVDAEGVIEPDSGRFALKAGDDLSVGAGSVLYGEQDFDAQIKGDATIGENSALVGDNFLGLQAGGNIELKAGSSIESFHDDEHAPHVELFADGNIRQDSLSNGVTAENLTAKAGGDVYLGSQFGNKVENAVLQAGDSIEANFNSPDVLVEVNPESDGELTGSLKLSNSSGHLDLDGSANVGGSVDITADGLDADDVTAGGSLAFDVGKGELHAGDLSSGADMTLSRRNQTRSGDIRTGRLNSGGATTMVNGNGTIDVQSSHSKGATMVFTSPSSPQPDVSLFSSDSGRVHISPNADVILGVWGRLDVHHMPFSEEALFSYGAAHHTPLLKWGYDTHDPKGRLFWLGLRNESTDSYTHLPIEGLVKVHNLWKGEATQIVLDKEPENDSESLLD